MNKAVLGEAIYHTANRMATNTFYSTAELDRADPNYLLAYMF